MQFTVGAEQSTGFLGRYQERMSAALRLLGHEVTIACANYVQVLRAASCHVHACFVQDLPAFLAALDGTGVTCSFSTFGLARPLRERESRDALEQLVASPQVSRVLIHSVLPGAARALGVVDSPKIAWVGEPLYDNPADFTVTRETARDELGLPRDRTIALCFGELSSSKGADLLAAAAREQVDPMVVFAGRGARAVAYPSPNVRVVDGYLDYRTAARYFRACDLVVMPYRRVYEHHTSGVLVQAALAQRPVLAPRLTPFRETIETYQLGTTFEAEDVTALAAGLRAFAASNRAGGGFSRLVAELPTWGQLAELIGGVR